MSKSNGSAGILACSNRHLADWFQSPRQDAGEGRQGCLRSKDFSLRFAGGRTIYFDISG